MQAPRSPEAVLYVWAVFLILASVSMAFSVAKGKHAASQIDADIKKENYSLQGKRTINIVLAFYTLCFFYLTILFLTMMAYGASSLLHVLLEAVFRNPVRAVLPDQTLRWLGTAEWALSHGTLFEFLSVRHWGTHAFILVCVLSLAALHSRLFVTQEHNESEAYTHTARYSLYAAFWGLYAIVIIRDLVRSSSSL